MLAEASLRSLSRRCLPLAAGIVIGSLVLLAGGVLPSGKLRESVAARDRRLAELREMTEADRERSKVLRLLEKRVEALEGQVRQGYRSLPAGEAEVERRIRETAARHLFKVERLEPGRGTVEPAYRVLSFVCTLEGPAGELRSFFPELQDRLALRSLESLRLASLEDRNVRMDFRLKVLVPLY